MLADGVEHRQRIILSSKPISYIAPSMHLYFSFIETKDGCQRTDACHLSPLIRIPIYFYNFQLLFWIYTLAYSRNPTARLLSNLSRTIERNHRRRAVGER